MMQITDIIENVRGSFAMEDMPMSSEDEQRGIALLSGTITIDEAIEEILNKEKARKSNEEDC